MARIALGALMGVVVGMTLGAACSARAQTEPTDDTVAAAAEAEAGLDATDLQGALNTTGLDARAYLAFLTAPETATEVPLSGRVACIVRVESRGDPNATNPRSGARGLGQFLDSTWMSTPQGSAGYSVYDATANLAAIQYMLDAGRAREFNAVSMGYC